VGYPVIDKEKMERLLYEIEHSPVERIAAELALARELAAACRRGYVPLAVQRVLARMPKQTEKDAWRGVAGLAPSDEPITDFMRENFE
jgi:hypothetical protein